MQASVYELPERVPGPFDIIVFWGVLYHLRHPLLGLDAVRRIATGTVSLETAITDPATVPEGSLATFHRLDDLGADPSNWWTPTPSALEDWCVSAGFDFRMVRLMGEPTPTRCLATLVARPEDPEYLRISYEQRLACRPLPPA